MVIIFNNTIFNNQYKDSTIIVNFYRYTISNYCINFFRNFSVLHQILYYVLFLDYKLLYT